MSVYPKRCAECGGAMAVSSDPIPFELRGETLMVPGVAHSTCERCGEVMVDLDGMAQLQHEAVRRYKEARGLLTPDEIKAIRGSLGLSQAAFEHLLGIGPKTVVRWEKGTVLQSVTADRLMRLIREMPGAIEVLRAAGRPAAASRRSTPMLGCP